MFNFIKFEPIYQFDLKNAKIENGKIYVDMYVE